MAHGINTQLAHYLAARLIDICLDLLYFGISKWNACTQPGRIDTTIITATCRAY